MADELSTIINDTTQYIVIRLGNEQYGIDIKYIDNIVRMQQITRVPQVSPYWKGVINLRGEVIPVLSLRMKMGLENDTETKDTRIIIIKIEFCIYYIRISTYNSINIRTSSSSILISIICL